MIDRIYAYVLRRLALLLVLTGSVITAGLADAAGLTTVDLTQVDGATTFRSTFQSHNQKIVKTINGNIFMASVRHEANGTWRLWRSVNNGANWTTVYSSDASHKCSGVPPVVETDESSNVYVCLNNQNAPGTIFFYRFLASQNYATANITSQTNSGGYGKYAMEYDQPRQQFYFIGQYGVDNQTYIQKINKNGTFNGARTKLTLTGPNGSGGSYPCLSLRNGTLHCMYTTGSVLFGAMGRYYDIHYFQSADGIATYRKMNATALTKPWVCDDTGPTDKISNAALNMGNNDFIFGANMFVRNNKGYFLYNCGGGPTAGQHFVRYNTTSGVRELDVNPASGGLIVVSSLDGFIAAKDTPTTSTIYVIGSLVGEEKVNCVASDDLGATWYDYAQSIRMPIDAGNPGLMTAYGKGGQPDITSDNYIIGAVAANDAPTGSTSDQASKLYFFKIKAGLSSALIDNVVRVGGTLTYTFSASRQGQPVLIRFQQPSLAWTSYQPFSTTVNLVSATDPIKFQLQSAIGTDSAIFDVPPTEQPAVVADQFNDPAGLMPSPGTAPNTNPGWRWHPANNPSYDGAGLVNLILNSGTLGSIDLINGSGSTGPFANLPAAPGDGTPRALLCILKYDDLSTHDNGIGFTFGWLSNASYSPGCRFIKVTKPNAITIGDSGFDSDANDVATGFNAVPNALQGFMIIDDGAGNLTYSYQNGGSHLTDAAAWVDITPASGGVDTLKTNLYTLPGITFFAEGSDAGPNPSVHIDYIGVIANPNMP